MGILMHSGVEDLVHFLEFVDESAWGNGTLI
jgi:hypothetical protein